MARNYAALSHEYLEEMAELTDQEFGRLVRALLRFSITGEETALDGNERFYWNRVVKRELGLQEHYREVCARRSAAGKKGMASRWGGITNDNKDEVQDKVKDKVYSLPSTEGKRRGAASAAEREKQFDSRIQKDVLELARFMEAHEA